MNKTDFIDRLFIACPTCKERDYRLVDQPHDRLVKSIYQCNQCQTIFKPDPRQTHTIDDRQAEPV